ncbi:MAG: prepilin-type N-terminal cleavage/methylation domain-containing protein [Burkholderiales bacterium]
MKKNRSRGMTIVEIVIVLAIIGILASIGIPLYNSYRFETMVAQARSDITSMDYQIAQFQADNQGQLPDSLGDIGQASLLDPWGNSYRYLNLTNMKGNGKVRKDKNLVPINSDYDLYSTGKDGSSQSPLTALASRDDIVRASNGRFVGLASDY